MKIGTSESCHILMEGKLKKKKIKEVSFCCVQTLLGTTKTLSIREEVQACWDFAPFLDEKAEKIFYNPIDCCRWDCIELQRWR